MAEQMERDVTHDALRRTPARGFASMDRERQREIASKGGRAAHAKGTAHEWTAEEARAAGRKGGETVSRDREHMAAIGRDGGGARSANARSRRISADSVDAHSGNGADEIGRMSHARRDDGGKIAAQQ
jgi:uncharacterized protein